MRCHSTGEGCRRKRCASRRARSTSCHGDGKSTFGTDAVAAARGRAQDGGEPLREPALHPARGHGDELGRERVGRRAGQGVGQGPDEGVGAIGAVEAEHAWRCRVRWRDGRPPGIGRALTPPSDGSARAGVAKRRAGPILVPDGRMVCRLPKTTAAGLADPGEKGPDVGRARAVIPVSVTERAPPSPSRAYNRAAPAEPVRHTAGRGDEREPSVGAPPPRANDAGRASARRGGRRSRRHRE